MRRWEKTNFFDVRLHISSRMPFTLESIDNDGMNEGRTFIFIRFSYSQKKIASSWIEGWKAHSKYFQFLVKWQWPSQAYANRPLISTSWNKLQWKHFYCRSLSLRSIQSMHNPSFCISFPGSVSFSRHQRWKNIT